MFKSSRQIDGTTKIQRHSCDMDEVRKHKRSNGPRRQPTRDIPEQAIPGGASTIHTFALMHDLRKLGALEVVRAQSK